MGRNQVACIYNAVESADWFRILAHTSGYRKRSGVEMNQVAYLIYLHHAQSVTPLVWANDAKNKVDYCNEIDCYILIIILENYLLTIFFNKLLTKFL